MKAAPMLLSAALVAPLAACTPALTGPQVGRIVNGNTGAEGTVAFTRGTLRPRIAGPYAADNVVIQIAGQTYSGRTVILDANASALPGNWGLSVGFGSGTNVGPNGFFGWDTHFGTPRQHASSSRTGNLIARTTGNTRTLTCNLLVDENEHGIGDCTDQSGVKYTLQF